MASRSALWITIRWGHTVLDVVHSSPPANFRVGEAAWLPSGFAVPASILGRQRLPLVRVDAATGDVWVVIAPGCTGTLTLAGRPSVSIHEASGGRPSVDVVGATELRLPLGSRATVAFFDLAFEIDHADAKQPARRLGPVAWRRMLIPAMVTLGLNVGLLFASARTIPTLDDLPEDELAMNDASTRLQITFSDPVERDDDEREPPASDGDDRHDWRTRCGGDQGAMGARDAVPASSRYGVAGPPDNADPHLARRTVLNEWADVQDVIGPIKPSVGDGPSPVMEWARDDALGTDAASATGRLWGEAIGVTRGSPGLGVGSRLACASCGAEGSGPRFARIGAHGAPRCELAGRLH
jgi:hypothetical protein